MCNSYMFCYQFFYCFSIIIFVSVYFKAVDDRFNEFILTEFSFYSNMFDKHR